MKTKTIFKALAAAMLMPAMLLTTACSSDDDLVNNEPTVNKGYALPVTVSATRQGDATTRATFDGSKLNFSAGDQLFVSGSHTSAGQFAGTLTWQSGGTFSGTIYTKENYTGNASSLFSQDVNATLLPAGYESTGYISISVGSSDLYDDTVIANGSHAFVASETAKATGVEQLSFERASTYYSSGFALAPLCAVLNFTISGLEAGAKNVTLYVTYNHNDYTVTGSVTPNASGVATFAVGVLGGINIKDMDNNLTVGSHNFTLPSTTTFTAGKIYNITRSAAPAPSYTMAAAATTDDIGKVICSNGHIHSNVSDVICGGSASAMIAYVGNQNNANGNGAYSSTCNHGLAIALADVINTSGDLQTSASASYTNKMEWEDAKTACNSFKGSKPSGVTWMLPSAYQWERMLIGCGGTTTYTTSLYDGENFSYGNFRTQLTNCGTNVQGVYDVRDYYWSSTEYSGGTTIYAWYYRFIISDFRWNYKTGSFYVRAAFAF